MGIRFLKQPHYPATIYLIAENRKAAEGLARHYALRRSYLRRMGVDRTTVISRWRTLPDTERSRNQVYRMSVLITDDLTLVTGVVRIALAIAAGVIIGGVIH